MIQTGLLNITIQFDWEEVGKITLDGASEIHVPKPMNEPAVYMIHSQIGRYVGETTDLRRRLQNYRKPGGSDKTEKPRTNRRIQRKVIKTLANHEVSVHKAVNLRTTKNGEQPVSVNLHNKHARLFVENAIIMALDTQGDANWNDPAV
jgi:hypothetical protein